jgi:hypothetical protein
LPFPVQELPVGLRESVREGALALGCDPACLAVLALAVVAAAIGTTRVLRLKPGWDEPCALWTAVVGDGARALETLVEMGLARWSERKCRNIGTGANRGECNSPDTGQTGQNEERDGGKWFFFLRGGGVGMRTTRLGEAGPLGGHAPGRSEGRGRAPRRKQGFHRLSTMFEPAAFFWESPSHFGTDLAK